MTRGEIRWCQGFSEPNAGSDLASLKTRRWTRAITFVNGTKIWTSYGDKSDWMYALVRTDPTRPSTGISLIVLDMQSPGVTVTPIDLISGKSSFCQVFFDNVKVPKGQLIGPSTAAGRWPRRCSSTSAGDVEVRRVQPAHPLRPDEPGRALPAATTRRPTSPARPRRAMSMEEHSYTLTVQRMGEEMRARQNVSGLMSIMKLVHSEQEKDKFEVLLDLMGHRAWAGRATNSPNRSWPCARPGWAASPRPSPAVRPRCS
jgi:hypothetical protein